MGVVLVRHLEDGVITPFEGDLHASSGTSRTWLGPLTGLAFVVIGII
jgi:hypothetical protein